MRLFLVVKPAVQYVREEDGGSCTDQLLHLDVLHRHLNFWSSAFLLVKMVALTQPTKCLTHVCRVLSDRVLISQMLEAKDPRGFSSLNDISSSASSGASSVSDESDT